MIGTIKNDLDWFLASICVRNEPAGGTAKDGDARHLTWINSYLIHAKDLSDAYDKAIKIGRSERGRYKGPRGMRKWRFVGLWDILPILDDLSDGEEIFWTDYGRVTARVAERRCISKRQLLRDYIAPKEKVGAAKTVRRTGASRSAGKRNRTLSAAGSRR